MLTGGGQALDPTAITALITVVVTLLARELLPAISRVFEGRAASHRADKQLDAELGDRLMGQLAANSERLTACEEDRAAIRGWSSIMTAWARKAAVALGIEPPPDPPSSPVTPAHDARE